MAELSKLQLRIQYNKSVIDKFRNYCVVCGETCKVCLDFHHLNKKTKKFGISHTYARSLKTLIKEVMKCVPLCVNDHLDVEYGNLVITKRQISKWKKSVQNVKY